MTQKKLLPQLMNSNLPLISINLLAYNHQDYIEECMRSVAQQNYPNKQLIIINDGSIDNTHKVIEEVLPSIKNDFSSVIYKNKKNEGITASLNLFLALVEGEYVASIAADDYFIDSDALQKLMDAILKDEKIDVVSANSIIVNKQSKQIYWGENREILTKKTPNSYHTVVEYYTRNRLDIDLKNISYKQLLKNNFISNSWLAKKDIIINNGGYEEGFEDWILWLKILRKHKIIYITECLIAYRWHDNNISHKFPLSTFKNTFLFFLREKQFCLKNGYYKDWLKQIDSMTKAILEYDKNELTFIKKHLGWRYYFYTSLLKLNHVKNQLKNQLNFIKKN